MSDTFCNAFAVTLTEGLTLSKSRVGSTDMMGQLPYYKLATQTPM